MNRRTFLGAAAGVGGLACWNRPGRLAGDRLVERWSWVMGQPVHITLYAMTEQHGLDAAALALTELRRVEGAISLFDASSDLVALNDRAGTGSHRVGPDLTALLVRSEALRQRTAGAFNPAVEPLMRAWGFHASRSSSPTSAELAAAASAVRQATVRIDARGIALGHRDTRLDLGGIGVGYGLDRAAAVLRSAGITRALIDISGDLLAIGSPPGERGWPVEIATMPGVVPSRVVTIADAALATSSNRQSVVRYDGVVTGHIFDPVRGAPAHALTQVSVVATTGTEADALSTAMMVTGQRVAGVREIVAVR